MASKTGSIPPVALLFQVIREADFGRLAQLVERLLYTQDATGSSPVSPTKFFRIFFEVRQYVIVTKEKAMGRGSSLRYS